MVSRKRRGVGLPVKVLEVIVVLTLAFAYVSNGHYITGLATDTTTDSVKASASVGTLIIVNGGDKSTLDAATASSISENTGVPVLFTGHNDVSPDVLSSLITGEYKDVTNVVILGGSAVVSDRAQQSLEDIGKTAGYDVVRLSGTTATGTAVEALKYFYGPEVLKEVEIVKYDGDSDQSYQKSLQLAAQLGKPIITVPADANG